MSAGEEDDVARRAALSQVLRFDEFRPLSAAVTVDIAAASQRGEARTTNEDHYLVARFSRQQQVVETSLPLTDLPSATEEHAYAMLVADGLGGTGRGALASRVALSTMAHVAVHFGRWHVRVDPQTAAEVMDRAEWFYNQVDRAVIARSRNDPRLSGMATTLTVAYSAGNDLFVANVGHSRAYLFRDGILTPLTRDHTLAQHFIDSGGPAPVDRGIQDLKHILTDAIGGDFKSPAVEVEHFFLVDGDWLLLCTNGLTDAVSEHQIAELLTLRRGAAEQCRLLLDLARTNGADDNATVITASYRVPGTAPRSFLP